MIECKASFHVIEESFILVEPMVIHYVLTMVFTAFVLVIGFWVFYLELLKTA